MSSAKSSTGNGIELLDPRDRHLGRALAAGEDVVVELPRDDDEAPHLGVLGRFGSSMTGLKPPSVSSLDRGGGFLQSKQPFRSHHHQRPRARVERLAADQVEVLRGARRVRDADVPLGGELQEALEPRARMLRAVAFVSVREEERQP